MILSAKISSGSFASLYEYLKRHETDIANDVHDFGELRRLFIDFFDRAPHKEKTDEQE